MFLAEPPMTPQLAEAFEVERTKDGYVMNLSRLWAWRPDVQQAFAATRQGLLGATSLSSREVAVIVCATASTLGDSYCSIAWGMRLALMSDPVTAAAVIEGERDAEALNERERALANWTRAVVAGPNSTSAADVEQLRAAGLNDREIFEATALAAFRLAFSTVNDALGVLPDAALAAQLPAELRAVIDYGRPAQGMAASGQA